MRVKNWSYYYKENSTSKKKKDVTDAIVIGVAAGLLWYAFWPMLGEYFPQFRDVDKGWLWLDVLLLWVTDSGLFKRCDMRVQRAATVAGWGIPFGYLLIHFPKMYSGILTAAKVYLVRFNPYQGTNILLPSGESENLPYALAALVMVLWLVLWKTAKVWKTPVVLLVLPLLAVLLDFLVGVSPGATGIVVTFAVAFLLLMPKGMGLFQRAAGTVVVLLCVYLAGTVFEERIDRFAEGRESMEEWLGEFEMPSFTFGNFLQLDLWANSETVNNRKPHYTGRVVFTVTTDKKPLHSQYMRGFYATDYTDGTWKCDRSTFAQACAQAGYSQSEVAKILAENPYEVIEKSGLFRDMGNSVLMEFQFRGNTLYAPYIFSKRAWENHYEFLGDYLIQKGWGDNKITLQTGTVGDLCNLSLYTTYARLTAGYPKMKWYNEVAESYTQRSDRLSCIDLAAEIVKARVRYPKENDLQLKDSRILYDSISLPTVLDNVYRMRLAEVVRSYLAERMEYSLNLDSIPNDTDAVEYALTKGKQGYCMHYASAAVLIFKELGIPARYASGYVVLPSEYEYDEKSGTYVANIEDYNSHAWAEIYLEDIGWIPIEVTEGYAGTVEKLPTRQDATESSESQDTKPLPTESQTEDTESESVDAPPTQGPTESQPTESQPTEKPTESQPTEESTEKPPKETETEQTEMEGGNTPSGDGKSKTIAGMCSLLVGAVVLVFVAKGVVFFYDYVLQKEMEDKQTRPAVQRIHKRVVRRVRIAHHGNGQLTDAHLEAILQEKYPQVSKEEWCRYMQIVQKMRYSKEAVTAEEMQEVYRCYQRIR